MLETKIAAFILWLKLNTEFEDWHPNVQKEVENALREILNSK